MSDPIFPLAVWQSGTNENSIPANDNALRMEAISRGAISKSTTAQPGSPSDGDVYVIPAAATGAQWATFDEDDIAIYRDGTWYAWAPVDGLQMVIAGTLEAWSSGWTPAGGGSADAVTYDNSISGLISEDVQDAIDEIAAAIGGSPGSALSALSILSGVVNIDCSLGDYFTLAMTANVTSVTFSNLPAAGYAQTIMIRATQDGTGNRTMTMPSSFDWASGTVGVLSTAANAVDVLALTTFNQGTNWVATLSKAHA